MKVRIISAAVALILFLCVILLNSVFPLTFVIALSLLNLMATREVLCNTKFSNHTAFSIWAIIYSFIAPSVYCYFADYVSAITLLYVLGVVILTLRYHKESGALNIAASIAFPIIISYAFSALLFLCSASDKGLFYFYLTLIFAWGSDTGAYFAGTFFGKHKLCPQISPKKTVEGVIGGIITSMILSFGLYSLYTYAFGYEGINLIHIIISAAILSPVGVIGDLFASQLKRKCGIKDYGNIMPGHGGVLDRFDSVLLIAPCFYMYLSLFSLV